MCIRVLEDGEHERAAHFRVVDAGAYEEAIAEIARLRSNAPETNQAQHAELLKRLPRVGADFVEEIQALSRTELERRVLIQKDWVHSYSRCLDGLDLKVGVESCRDPRDIRRIVESLRPELKAAAPLHKQFPVQGGDAVPPSQPKPYKPL